MERFDVVIAGGGIAGLFAALHLGKSLKILLIERQQFPPFKPCGGLLVEEAYRCLADFNPPVSVFLFHEERFLTLVDMDNRAIREKVQRIRILRRPAFLSWMRSLLPPDVEYRERTTFVSASAEEGETVIVVRSDGRKTYRVSAGILIGADGASSSVRRILDAPKPGWIRTVQYHCEAENPPDNVLFVFNASFSNNYYSWIVPAGDGAMVIGGALDDTEWDKLGDWVKIEFGARHPFENPEYHPITRIKSTESLKTGAGNILLVGEAGGFVRPSSGEGISLALKTAQAAALALSSGPDGAFERYKKLCIPVIDTLARDLRTDKALYDPALRAEIFGLK